jgi:hydrogenase maturation protease
LGNELISDDAVGILIARRLKSELNGVADVIESGLSGLALLDLLLGYDQAIIVDSISTGKDPPGTIIELEPDDLGHVMAPSPHYTGLPEIISIARELGLEFPSRIRIIAIEGKDLETIGGAMSSQIILSIEEVVKRIKELIQTWNLETPEFHNNF